MNNTPRWMLYLITLSLPLVFFLILEGALRLIGYGQQMPLFIENPTHPDYQLARPDIIKRYFPASHSSQPDATNTNIPKVTMEPHFFLRDKPDNGYRIFVQGGSTAAGYPYGLGASLAGMLEGRVRASQPTRYVEVINTAMSAVNSYMLLDFADEIIAQSPDAVLIYAGHNEYLGILGVGSNFVVAGSSFTTRMALALKDWRLFQLLQNTYAQLSDTNITVNTTENNTAISDKITTQSTSAVVGSSAAPQSTTTSSRTLMSQVAKHKNITRDSNLFSAGLAQYETNMRNLLSKYAQAGVPVYLATVASNEKDHAPFASQPIPASAQPLLTQLMADFTPNHTPNLAATTKPNPTANPIPNISAILSTLKDIAQQAQSADLHYAIGQYCFSVQNTSCAQAQFALATEHDLLRFRAPAAINDIIRKLAGEYSHVTLVDAQAALRARVPYQIIGQNVMLEHLHPNVSGYFVIANAFYNALIQNQQLNTTINANTAWPRRPILPSEEYKGFADVLTLMSDYPFTDTPKAVNLPAPSNWETALGRAAHLNNVSWADMMQESLKRYKQAKNIPMFLKTSLILADAMPHDGMINLQSAKLLERQRRLPEALYYYQRAQRAGGIGLEASIARLKQRLGQT